jgi:hypothetical protein
MTAIRAAIYAHYSSENQREAARSSAAASPSGDPPLTPLLRRGRH